MESENQLSFDPNCGTGTFKGAAAREIEKANDNAQTMPQQNPRPHLTYKRTKDGLEVYGDDKFSRMLQIIDQVGHWSLKLVPYIAVIILAIWGDITLSLLPLIPARLQKFITAFRK